MVHKPRVVIAGQIPPPFGGQTIMIQEILAQSCSQKDWQTIHLALNFNRSFHQIRKISWLKCWELVNILYRLIRIRLEGKIDLLIFPFGGKHLAPVLRDLFLIPFAALCSKKLVVWFHTGGIKEALPSFPKILKAVYLAVFKLVDSAVVMTPFNRCDPESLAIHDIHIVPHSLRDEYSHPSADRTPGQITMLYLGHLYPDKGILELVSAFSILAPSRPWLKLNLVGEPVSPWKENDVRSIISNSSRPEQISWHGLALGNKKNDFLKNADLFIFPSIAPGESFGLVLAEALMWRLPVIATDWRGNKDVLTSNFYGRLVSAYPLKAKELADKTEELLNEHEKWTMGGDQNRRIFLEHYLHQEETSRVVTLIRQLLVT